MHQFFPTASGLHVLIVHIPIVLLLAAPVLVLVGAALPAARGAIFQRLALIIMIAGTCMAFAAVATGREAVGVAAATAMVAGLLEQHRSLAETTIELFSVLTVGFAALLFVPRLLKCEIDAWINRALLAAFLVFYASGVVFLVDTMLQGGRLAQVLDTKTAATYQLSEKGGAK